MKQNVIQNRKATTDRMYSK